MLLSLNGLGSDRGPDEKPYFVGVRMRLGWRPGLRVEREVRVDVPALGDGARQYFNMDSERDDWSFEQPERTLFVLKSRFDSSQLQRFIKSEAWGPLAVNITSVADLKYSYQPGGIHADDFINW